jgi:hypothetical protein
MVDSPTTRNRLRKQEVGTNNNTWGTKLNEVLDCVDQVVDGVEAVDLGAATSYTLTTSDYTTTDQAKNRVLVCSNLNAAGSDLIVPNVEHVYGVRNSGATTLEIKTSAGTGVEIPAGRFTWVYCDGTNVISAAATSLPAAFVPSLANDPATVDYVDTAIATAGLPATAGTVLVSGGDTTAGYLGQKIAVAGDLALSIQNPAGDENSLITHTPYWNAPRYVATVDSPVTALDRDIIFVNTAASVEIDLPASGRVWIIDQTGDANVGNVTVDPAGADTTTIDTIDLPYFSAVFTRNASGNWDIS